MKITIDPHPLGYFTVRCDDRWADLTFDEMLAVVVDLTQSHGLDKYKGANRADRWLRTDEQWTAWRSVVDSVTTGAEFDIKE